MKSELQFQTHHERRPIATATLSGEWPDALKEAA